MSTRPAPRPPASPSWTTARRVASVPIAPLACALLSAACGHAAPPETAGPAAEARAEEPAWLSDPRDPVAARMREIVRRMAEAGLGVGEPSGRGFLAGREREAFELSIPARRCVTIVALASRGIRDLDATLWTPDGAAIAEDVEPDPHPTIQVCGGVEGRRLWYGLHAYDGDGSYAFASFSGDRASFEAAAAIAGGRPGVAADTRGGEAADVRLSEVASGLERRGFRPHGDVARLALRPGERVRVGLAVERGHCYAVVALPGAGTGPVELALVDELGRELVTDRAGESEPGLQHCADRDAELGVDVGVTGAGGPARIAMFVAPSERAGGTSGLWLGRRPEQRWARAATFDLAARLAGPGWQAARPVTELALGLGEAASVPVRLPSGGRCARFVVTVSPGLAGLDVRLLAPAGELLAAAEGDGAGAFLTACAPAERAARLVIVARRGAGRASVQTMMGPAPPETDAQGGWGARLDQVDGARARGLRSRPLREGSEAAPELVRLERGVARVPLEGPGACALLRVDAAGGPSVLELSVLDGERITALARGVAPSLVTCPSPSSARTLRVRGDAPAVWIGAYAEPADGDAR